MTKIKLIYDWPPNAETEDKKRKDVAINYKGDIYLPNGNVREDIIIHEKVHIKQQKGDYDGWIEHYQTDISFRIEQEVEAYKEQIKYIKKTMGRKKAFYAMMSFAKFLSSEVYGNIITFEKALKKLKL